MNFLKRREFPAKMANPVHAFALLLLVSVPVYLPVLNTGFFSDDFVVLDRIQHANFYQGSFFRPLSDLSIYLDYLLWGRNAIGFHITSLFLHVLTSWTIYLVIPAAFKYLNIVGVNPFIIAVFCSLLFLIYPFHNEPVVWTVGRGVILATLLTLLSFLLYLKSENSFSFLFASVLFYFLALFGYESVLTFPLILLSTELARGKVHQRIGNIIVKIIPFITVLALYLLIRWYNIGGLIGSSSYFRISVSAYDMVLNFLRLLERTVLPPLENYKIAMVLATAVFTVAGLILYIKRNALKLLSSFLILLSVSFLLALLPVLTIGINTHTTEGERFLYFPSVFFTLLLGTLVFVTFKTMRSRSIMFFGIVIYFLYFTVSENKNWNRSSKIVNDLIANHKRYFTDGKLYLINMPDNLDGAFVFRNGFFNAFQFYGKPFVRKDQLMILTWLDLHHDHQEKTRLQKDGSGLRIGDRFLIQQRSGANGCILYDKSTHKSYPVSQIDKVFYFDGRLLQQVFL